MTVITVVVFAASLAATTPSTTLTSTPTSLTTTARQCGVIIIIYILLGNLFVGIGFNLAYSLTVRYIRSLSIFLFLLLKSAFGTFRVDLLTGCNACDYTRTTVSYRFLHLD